MNAETIEKIEAYLERQISRSDLETFASAKGIQDLEEQIDWVRDVALAVEADGVKSQIADLLSAAKDRPESAKVVSLGTSRWIIGLAASLLLIVTAYFGLQNQSSNESQQYAQYEYTDPGLPVVMSQSSNYALYDALTYFGEHDYETALAKFAALPNTSNDTVAYYLGASYHYQDDYEQAVSSLVAVAENSSSVFQQKAQWLLVLSYLRSNKKEQARLILEQISSNANHQFNQQALSLLQEI